MYQQAHQPTWAPLAATGTQLDDEALFDPTSEDNEDCPLPRPPTPLTVPLPTFANVC